MARATALNATDLLRSKDVASLLRVHPKQVYRLMRRGLPALRVGGEWRFSRGAILEWAAHAGADEGRAVAVSGSCPSLLAANGDLLIEDLLECARREGALLGFVQADHVVGTALLLERRVLACGQHVGVESGGAKDGAFKPKMVRVVLATREIGLASAPGARMKNLAGVAGKRVATRPVTAGIRRRFDAALLEAGVDAQRLRKRSVEYASHRDVALAVARGDADVGLTTHAWAEAAGLPFWAMGEEDYGVAFLAEHIDDPRVSTLCEVAQSRAFRRRLRTHAGYEVSRTGRVSGGGSASVPIVTLSDS
jgi:excisionase family DNA binding protein